MIKQASGCTNQCNPPCPLDDAEDPENYISLPVIYQKNLKAKTEIISNEISLSCAWSLIRDISKEVKLSNIYVDAWKKGKPLSRTRKIFFIVDHEDVPKVKSLYALYKIYYPKTEKMIPEIKIYKTDETRIKKVQIALRKIKN